MQSTSNISRFTKVSYRGGAPINGFLVGPKERNITIGGFLSTSNTLEGIFGRVVSANIATPHEFLVGSAGAKIQGVLVFNEAIAQNQPAGSDHPVQGTPCTVLSEGYFGLTSWGKTATGAADPTITSKVVMVNATGAIEFLPSATAVPGTCTQLNAEVVDHEGSSVVSGKVVVIKLKGAA